MIPFEYRVAYRSWYPNICPPLEGNDWTGSCGKSRVCTRSGLAHGRMKQHFRFGETMAGKEWNNKVLLPS